MLWNHGGKEIAPAKAGEVEKAESWIRRGLEEMNSELILQDKQLLCGRNMVGKSKKGGRE
jgi:hypothetical protein